MPSGYEPTREPLLKRMFFGGSARSRYKREENNAFTYTSPQPLTFVRKEIEIDHIDGDSVVLSDSRLRIDRKCRRQLRAACAGLMLVAAGVVSLSACGGAPETAYPESASHHEPARVEPIKGTDVERVIFSAEGAKRVGLRTATIRQDGREKIMPYAALLYDAEGKAFTYTSPKPLTFVLKQIKVDHVDGDSVVLSEGPPAGTEVVTAGAPEVYGAEFNFSEGE